jgi:two-component system, LytTR family, sensor kinase
VYAWGWAMELLGTSAEPFSWSLAPLIFAWRGMFHWNLLVYWVIVGAYVAYDYYDNFRERQLRTVELERLLAESRLEALRAQLHPHFLFNALNAISAHVEREPRTARRMLEQLGELLRLTLDHCEDQEIPLEREISFLDRYLAIQQVRFEDRLEAKVEIAPETLDALLPTFILQPMVENAIQHGVSRRSSKGSIGVTAWREHQRLRLRVWDDGPGLPAGWDPEEQQGLGISNTRERLRRLYGDTGHTFEVVNDSGGGVSVNISLPFRRAREAYGDHSSSARG